MPEFGDPRLPIRFWSKVSVAPTGCWEWNAARTPKGYGQFQWEGRHRPAHRVAYEALVAVIIPGELVCDHLCRTRHCVNPAHIEPVTMRENFLRGDSRDTNRRRGAAITHCKHGHKYTPETTIILSGRRTCRLCHRITYNRYYARKQAAKKLKAAGASDGQ